MFDGDKDGVFQFTTDDLPAGSYEVKVAHNLSWDENYGAGGDRGGANITFTASDGKVVMFRYTLATHVLVIRRPIRRCRAPASSARTGSTPSTIAWPGDLGAAAADASWQLYASADASLALADGEITGGDAIDLTRVAGGLTAEQKERFPALAGFTALHVEGQDRDAVGSAAAGPAHGRRSATPTTPCQAYTGVQIPGVLDDLYAGAARRRLTRRDLRLEQADVPAVGADGAAPRRCSRGMPGRRVTPCATRRRGTRHPESGPSRGRSRSRATSTCGRSWSTPRRPATIETNAVTDPYSVALTTNSERSVAIDLDDKAWRPKGWEKTKPPVIDRPVDRAIYELHIRDFSITDETVPAAERGTYRAFTRDSAGTTQLKQLAAAGINTVHLLPSFDIATIEENRAAQAVPDCDLESYGPASTEQQACIATVADTDGFNWGYDPYHYSVPEGSYAVDPEGGARVGEFREMVGALHGMGLQVVLDEVFNHTAQSGQGEKSVLDQVVPGYYQRLNATGAVETSTCCQNVATEHAVAQKLMVDSVVTWARDYKVDGFRFDLMGHHSRENMLAIRAALDELTVKKDGVDGKAIYLYGEGWNFGEVANNALFEQATQGQARRHRHRHLQRPPPRRRPRRQPRRRRRRPSSRASARASRPTPTATRSTARPSRRSPISASRPTSSSSVSRATSATTR